MRIYCLLFFFLVVALPLMAQTPEPSPTPTPPATSEPAKVVDSALRVQPAAKYTPPDAKTRRKRFVKSLIGPRTLGTTVVKAGIATWRNSPEEWGPTWEGFARRVASRVARNTIKQSTMYGLDEAFKIDSHFYRSKNRSVSARVRNALISPVTARDRNGKRVFGLPRIAATYGSGIIAYETWYPDRFSWKNGVRSGTISLGFNAAFNLFKEFVWKK